MHHVELLTLTARTRVAHIEVGPLGEPVLDRVVLEQSDGQPWVAMLRHRIPTMRRRVEIDIALSS